MPKGGHGRSGRVIQDAETRALHGSRTRPIHREKGDPGAPMVACGAPPGLSKAETRFWDYYAPQLRAEKRLTLKSRDSLAKYCTSLAVVEDLRKKLASRKKEDLESRRDNLKELRQWVLASRHYENDLLLNPSSAMRAPRAMTPENEEDLTQPAVPEDAFSEFDDPDGSVQ